MKKKARMLMVALIGIIMAVGLTLVSCKDDSSSCSENGNCYYSFSSGLYRTCNDNRCAITASQTATRCDC